MIDVGERLRLHALRRIDDEQRALARREAAADFIGEVDVPRRVHQIEDMAFPFQTHRLRLDGDPPLLFNLHVIKHLRAHLALGEPPGALDQPVRQGRLAMVDMRDDREVTNLGKLSRHEVLPA